MNKPAPQPGTLESIIAGIASEAAKGSVNESRVIEIVTEQFAELAKTIDNGPRSFKVIVNDVPTVEIKGTAHKLLAEVIGLVKCGFRNILLVGPAGCGKTTLGAQLAESLGYMFGSISCSPGLPESALLGRLVPNLTDGTERYRSAPLVECLEHPSVFLLDEVDNGDASTTLVLNSLLANGHVTLPDGRRAERHADSIILASANTYGHGQSREYVGRAPMDAAFTDRFVGATLTMDYDHDLEKQYADKDTLEMVHRLRADTRRLKIRRPISTRAVIAAGRLRAGLKLTLGEVARRLTDGWSDEDRKACSVPLAA